MNASPLCIYMDKHCAWYVPSMEGYIHVLCTKCALRINDSSEPLRQKISNIATVLLSAQFYHNATRNCSKFECCVSLQYKYMHAACTENECCLAAEQTYETRSDCMHWYRDHIQGHMLRLLKETSICRIDNLVTCNPAHIMTQVYIRIQYVYFCSEVRTIVFFLKRSCMGPSKEEWEHASRKAESRSPNVVHCMSSPRRSINLPLITPIVMGLDLLTDVSWSLCGQRPTFWQSHENGAKMDELACSRPFWGKPERFRRVRITLLLHGSSC